MLSKMFKKVKNKKDISNEDKAIRNLSDFLIRELGLTPKYVENKLGNALMFYNEAVTVALTVTSTNKRRLIKIDYLEVAKKYRNKGIATKVLFMITGICLQNGTTAGLWVEKGNKKLLKWYSKRGYKLIETLDDHWLEYDTDVDLNKYMSEFAKKYK